MISEMFSETHGPWLHTFGTSAAGVCSGVCGISAPSQPYKTIRATHGFSPETLLMTRYYDDIKNKNIYCNTIPFHSVP